MILRFRGCPHPVGSRWHRELPQMEIGREYEVAEIYEMEGYTMARPPDAPRWPAPGDPGFGILPEWFELTSEPIPIVSCGYYYNDHLQRLFGVVLVDRRQIEAIRHLRAIDVPETDEDLDTWQRREVSDANNEIAQALHDLLSLPVSTEFGVCPHVFRSAEVNSDTLAYAGAYLDDLARQDVRTDDYSEMLGRLLVALEIPSFEVQEIELAFWQGTQGGARLVSAPPDGRLVYGTENPPEFEPGAERATTDATSGEGCRG